MPVCTNLEYHANHLELLRHFHHLPLDLLCVSSGQWNVIRGNWQLVAMGPIIIASAQSLTNLVLKVQCSEQLLAYMLSLLPVLYSLRLGLACPQALSEVFFWAFTATRANEDSSCEMVGPPGQVIEPLCGDLEELHLSYKRWIRCTEKRALIPVFSDIVLSWGKDFSLDLSFDGPKLSWTVQVPVGRLHGDPDDQEFIVGISS